MGYDTTRIGDGLRAPHDAVMGSETEASEQCRP